MKTLCLIPARGGSKAIPGKNLALLNERPLIQYSIELAKTLFPVEDICVSSDSKNLIIGGQSGFERGSRPEWLDGDIS